VSAAGGSFRNKERETYANTLPLPAYSGDPCQPYGAGGRRFFRRQMEVKSRELTYKLKGKTTETDRMELSADGRTLTDTVTYPGESKAEVDMFDRQ
jgi:hypothetical protein